jgi:hypothetical protein
MKKLFLVGLFLSLFTSFAFGWGGNTSSDWKTYSVTNTLGSYKLTAVSNDIIPKGSAILGYKIMPLSTSSENMCTIYDGGVSSLDEVIGEAECAPASFDGEWYPYRKTLQKQIYIHQGPNTVVTIMFE